MENFKSFKMMMSIMSAGLALTACGGGSSGVGDIGTVGGSGGSSSAAAAPYSQAAHDALAQQFIAEATKEGLGFTLVKQDTQQQGYIIVQTPSGILEAFNVDNWKPGNSASSFAPDYTGLAPAGNSTYAYFINQGYEDTRYVSSGQWGYDSYGNSTWIDTSGYVDYGWVDTSYNMIFEVAQATPKDLQKIAAFKQSYEINSSAQQVQQKFGLSLERAVQVAKLAIQVKNTPKMSNDDYDSLSQQLLGVPLSKLDKAIAKTVNGDASSKDDVNDIINSAASTNGVGPEQARTLLNSLTKSKGN